MNSEKDVSLARKRPPLFMMSIKRLPCILRIRMPFYANAQACLFTSPCGHREGAYEADSSVHFSEKGVVNMIRTLGSGFSRKIPVARWLGVDQMRTKVRLLRFVTLSWRARDFLYSWGLLIANPSKRGPDVRRKSTGFIYSQMNYFGLLCSTTRVSNLSSKNLKKLKLLHFVLDWKLLISKIVSSPPRP